MKNTNQIKAKTESSLPTGRQTRSAQTVHFEFTNPSAQRVCVAGSFNDWKPEIGEMTRKSDGKWVKDLTLEPGTYEYRIVVDVSWITDPNANAAVPNPFGERNSLLNVAK